MTYRMNVFFTGVLLVSVSACSDNAATAPAVAEGAGWPALIPIEVSSEGIAAGPGKKFFVGNLRPTFPNTSLASIYVGDVSTGALAMLLPNDGRPTAGMKYDNRTGYLFAARGTSGWATVVHATTGATIADMQFAPNATTVPSFVNDVIVTKTAAYFTDSRRAVMYRVPLRADGALAGGFDVVPLTGDFVQGGAMPCLIDNLPGPLFSNGIEVTANDQWLIINSLANGRLYRVDPATGAAKSIDLGTSDVCLADGNLLAGNTLYVMQNLLSRIAVVTLAPDFLSGKVERRITGTTPMTTMARFGDYIYAVSAGFAFLPATQPRQVVRFPMN